jgi:signal transduction histidine kinase
MNSRITHRRAVLAVATLIGVGLLVALALALAKTQRDARHTVEDRFADGSKAAASLVQTIVQQAYTSDAALGREALGGTRVTDADAAKALPRTGSAALVVLDAHGARLALAPAAASALPIKGPHVRSALAGRPAISGALRSGRTRIVEVAVPYDTAHGRRILLIPSPLSAVQRVLGPYLAGLPGLEGHRAYITGAVAEVLAAANPREAPDAALTQALRRSPRTANVSYDGDRRQLSRTAIGGTTWDLVDTAKTSVLYAPINGWRRALPWLMLLLLLPALAFIVLLADRAARAAQRARQASEAKSAFLASMSHELRTPMTTVIGFSEMLQGGALGELTDKQQEVVGHIVTGSRHLNQLINEVLDLSRVEEGRLTFHPEEAAPHKLVGEVVDGMRGLADDRGVRIVVDAPEIGTFRLDPSRFKQVLYNLIGNAVKFTEAGGEVIVTLRAAEHGELLVSVTDYGPGVHPDEVDRIFLPFEQGSYRSGGAGLGLAVSRRIVDAQGGRIDVASRPGEGATFTVTLPPGT